MAKTLVFSGLLFIVGTALWICDPKISLPGQLEDIFRLLILAKVGFGLGLIASIMWEIRDARIARADAITFQFLAVAFFGATFLIALEIIARMRLEFVTWRAIMTAIVYAVGDVGLVRFWMKVHAFRRKYPYARHLSVIIEDADGHRL